MAKQPIPIKYGKKIQHSLDWLSDGVILGIIVGRSGSGKTTILSKIIPNITQLKHVIICSVLPGLPVHNAVKKWCETQKIEYHFASSPEDGKTAIENVIAKKEESMAKAVEEEKKKKEKLKKKKGGYFFHKNLMKKYKHESESDEGEDDQEVPIHLQEWSLIIFDDFTCGRKSYTCKYSKLQVMAFQMLRNKYCHMITVTQSYSAGTDTAVRNNANLRIRFNMNDYYAMQAFRKDVEHNSNIDMDGYMMGESMIAKDKYGFIIVGDDKLYVGVKAQNYEPMQYISNGGQNTDEENFAPSAQNSEDEN